MTIATADCLLQVVRRAKRCHQVLLRFQPVNIFLNIIEQFLHQGARDEIALFAQQFDGDDQIGVLRLCCLQVAGNGFRDRLANQQFAEVLQVGQAFQQEDALDQVISCFQSR